MRVCCGLIMLALLGGCGADVTVSIKDDDFVFIYTSTGAVQCESAGQTTEQTAQQLIAGGIDVTQSQCGIRTGVNVVSQCGAADITINLHQIKRQNLPDARLLGFDSISTLRHQGGAGYDVLNCF